MSCGQRAADQILAAYEAEYGKEIIMAGSKGGGYKSSMAGYGSDFGGHPYRQSARRESTPKDPLLPGLLKNPQIALMGFIAWAVCCLAMFLLGCFSWHVHTSSVKCHDSVKVVALTGGSLDCAGGAEASVSSSGSWNTIIVTCSCKAGR